MEERLRSELTMIEHNSSVSKLLARGGVRAAIVLGMLQFVPLASAHGGTVRIVQWASLIPLVLGIAVVAGSIAFDRVFASNGSRYAVYGVFVGIVLAAAGAAGLVQLSQIQSFSTTQSPIPEALYQPLTVVAGTAIATGGVLLGRIRWPTKPRYAGLAILLGLWVGYPGMMNAFGLYGETNPAGYVIVLTLPLAVGYVLWRDGRGLLADLYHDRLARRFGIGIGVVASVFFLFSSGLLSFAIDNGTGISWSHGFVTVFPVVGPLVRWPALEIFVPRLPFITPILEFLLPANLFLTPPYVPFRGAISPGIVILVGTIGALVGLNGATITHFWQGDGSASTASGGDAETGAVAGAVALTAPNVCCCCGPVLAEFAAVLVGPSAAMPFYWLFVDISSPVGAIFFAATIFLLLGNFVRAARMNRTPKSCVVEIAPSKAGSSSSD